MEKMKEGLHGLCTCLVGQSGYWGVTIPVREESSKTEDL